VDKQTKRQTGLTSQYFTKIECVTNFGFNWLPWQRSLSNRKEGGLDPQTTLIVKKMMKIGQKYISSLPSGLNKQQRNMHRQARRAKLEQIAETKHNGGVFLLRQTDLTDLARCVCRSFIRPSVSFLVF